MGRDSATSLNKVLSLFMLITSWIGSLLNLKLIILIIWTPSLTASSAGMPDTCERQNSSLSQVHVN